MIILRCSARAMAVLIAVAPLPLAAQDSVRSRTFASVFIVGAAETVAIAVSYERPSAVGRGVLGDLVPYDRPWITGIAAPAEINCPRPFAIGNLKIPAGTYTLWTLPTRNGVTLIVNSRFGPGASTYDSSADVGRVALTIDSLPQPVDPFRIFFRTDRKGPDTLITQYDARQSATMHGEHFTIDTRTGNVQNLVMTWDRFRWSLPVKLQ